jgi:hypothetical protein
MALAITTAVTVVLSVIYPLGLHGAVTRLYSRQPSSANGASEWA